MQRVKRHQRDGRRAIRIRDDALVPLHVGGVDFGDHERTAVIHAKGAGIVHDDASCLRRDGREPLEMLAARAEQRDVHARERVRGQLLDGDVLPAKLQFLARGPRGGEQRQFAHREIAFFERLDHFHAHRASRAHHRHMRSPVHKADYYIAEFMCVNVGSGLPPGDISFYAFRG